AARGGGAAPAARAPARGVLAHAPVREPPGRGHDRGGRGRRAATLRRGQPRGGVGRLRDPRAGAAAADRAAPRGVPARARGQGLSGVRRQDESPGSTRGARAFSTDQEPSRAPIPGRAKYPPSSTNVEAHQVSSSQALRMFQAEERSSSGKSWRVDGRRGRRQGPAVTRGAAHRGRAVGSERGGSTAGERSTGPDTRLARRRAKPSKG